MGISFFKVPQHRVFHYEPRYWDERKERREMVKNEALREKALREGKEWRDESYRPGMYISGKFQEQARNSRRSSLNKTLTRIIGLVSVATFIALLYFFAKYATIVLESLR
ncbi:MAG TPA: hypothetical protein IAC05_07420 [Candidatus Coprenecus stercorigallinarum]|nr:hypothetical protein [Candidatus Coprenecus stercorigallinarum]